MRFKGLGAFLSGGGAVLAKGPVAVILAEDGVEVDSTLRHHLAAGFGAVLLLAHPDLAVGPEVEAQVHRIDTDIFAEGALVSAVNRLIGAAPGVWFYYGFNAEYLFFPFCETRNIRELIAFQTEERRDAMLCYVIDLYAADLGRHPLAVSRDEAHLDGACYYALARKDSANHDHPKERQLDFYGGLRWRFEEHVPPTRRRIDRIALFRAKPGLVLLPDFTFNDQEYNTFSSPWHHNVTSAVCSFRAAKALKSNPGSKHAIRSFLWHNSVRFAWTSQQLMDLGLMEPGQWF